MIGKQNRMHFIVQSIFPVVLLLATSAAYGNPVQDGDQDGIADVVDADHDNDGLLNSTEGYVIVADPGLLPVDSYRSLFDSADTGPRDQLQGSSFRYPLSDIADNRAVDFQGTILSTNTSINWSGHDHSPKLQHEQPGWSHVRWNILDAAVPMAESIDIDLFLTDLDVERSEAVEIEKRFIIGYSLAGQSSIEVSELQDNKLLFTATGAESGAAAGSVVLHIRRQQELIIGYRSSKNVETLPGLNNDRAGFRHEFSGPRAALQEYTAIRQQRDTDQDGSPDHLDADSDNDGIYDVAEALGLDADNNGVADGIVSSIGVPASAGAGLTGVDLNGNGIADPYDFEPVVSTVPSGEVANSGSAESSANTDRSADGPVEETPLDTDNDGLTDVQELYLGTDAGLVDTDGDGFSDSEEVVVFHTDPLSSTATPSLQEPDVSAAVEYIDSDNDGIADHVETLFDVDGDGVPNLYDLDSDNDGIADLVEAGQTDLDNDGQLDSVESGLIKAWDQLADHDNDGIPNAFDLDSDQDGINDLAESGETDFDDNGVIDTPIDRNGDGWHDQYTGSQRVLPDSDNDGTADYLDPVTSLPPEEQSSTLQNDPVTAAAGEMLHTGLSGGAGCTLNDAAARDYSLLFLALLALAGLVVRQRARGILCSQHL